MSHARDQAGGPDADPARSPLGDPGAIVASFESLPAAVFVHEGPEHVFVGLNRLARAMLRDRAVLGKPFRAAMPDLEGQRMCALMDEAYRTGEPRPAREWRLLFADDDSSDLREVFVDFSVVPYYHPDGTVRGVLGHATDVTADVAAREASQARAEQRYRAAQDIVLALQDTLLPESLPVLPGVQLAAHYLVAGSEQAAGGDWFDAVGLPDGRLALVVGDVVGHGARASAVMGLLRAVLTAFLGEGAGPAEAMARLDRYAARTPGALAATVCLAVLDPATGELSYAGAGHPPPLLVTAAGDARYLPVPAGAPLGTAGEPPPSTAGEPPPAVQRAQLGRGDIVMLYTDGLVERPGQALSEGQQELLVYAADSLAHGSPDMMAGAAVDRVCRLSLERMTRQGYTDDVSLIAAQWTGARADAFRAELPAVPSALTGLREDLDGWLGGLGVTAQDVRSIQLAVGEAATNAIEHAYTATADPAGGTVVVEAYHDVDGRACLTVRDSGRWRPPPPEPALGGRGLVMIRGCMDTVEVDATATGTVVLMDLTLGRAPVFGAGIPAARPSATVVGTATTLCLDTECTSPPVLAARGPIDVNTAAQLRTQLQVATRGGVFPLVLDLSETSHLASAGVQVLHEFAEQMAADGHRLRLVAPSGSPARQVLRLAGLEHLACDGSPGRA